MYDISLEAFSVKKAAKSIGEKAKEVIKKIVERIKIIVDGIVSIIDKLNDHKIQSLVDVIKKRDVKKELGDKKITVKPVLFPYRSNELSNAGTIVVKRKPCHLDDPNLFETFTYDIFRDVSDVIEDANVELRVNMTKENLDVLRKFSSINVSTPITVTINDYMKDCGGNIIDGSKWHERMREVKNDIKYCKQFIKKLESKNFELTVSCDYDDNADTSIKPSEFVRAELSSVLTIMQNTINQYANDIHLIKIFARHLAKANSSNNDASKSKTSDDDFTVEDEWDDDWTMDAVDLDIDY